MIAGGTIVAPSSAAGRSARSLVRFSGPGARAIFEGLAPEKAPGGVGTVGRGVYRGRLRMGAEVDLAVLALWHPGPRSFTGEDVLELLLPGNPGLVARVVSIAAGREGVREAIGGEFSARAYLHGRLTLEQGEGVAALLAATREADLDVARELASGRTGAEYRRLREELVGLLALVEAGIDFTDQEDVVPIPPRQLAERLDGVGATIARWLGGARRDGESWGVVALVGEPSAGKSTLFNALLGRRRAVTSPTRGTTRDAIDEPLDLAPAGGLPLRVVLRDTPGIDEGASGASATTAQLAARESAASADLLLWCDPTGRFDAPAGASGWDPGRTIRVRTFADRPAPRARAGVEVCAPTGQGLAELSRLVGERISRARSATASALLARHARGLDGAREALGEARGLVSPAGRTVPHPELVADGIRTAMRCLEELSGRVEPDDVLGKVFASFCVGK